MQEPDPNKRLFTLCDAIMNQEYLICDVLKAPKFKYCMKSRYF